MREAGAGGWASPPCQYLLFRLGGTDFAIAQDAVLSILPNPGLLPLAPAPHAITGILPHPTLPRYVLDLRLKFSLRPSTPYPTALTLKGAPAALLVDTILDSVAIPARLLRAVRAHPRHPYRRYTSAVWRGRSRPCFVLDLGLILGLSAGAATQSPGADLSVPRFDPRRY